jgi:hypothetical protein
MPKTGYTKLVGKDPAALRSVIDLVNLYHIADVGWEGPDEEGKTSVLIV